MSNEQLRDSRKLPIFIHSEIDDLPLSSKAFRVYAHLARRAGTDNTAWPSYQSIGDHCFSKDSDSPRTRRNWAMAFVSELVEAGLVSKETRKDDGGFTSNLYFLVDPSPSTGTRVVPTQGLGVVPTQGLKGTPSKGTPSNQGEFDGFAAKQLLTLDGLMYFERDFNNVVNNMLDTFGADAVKQAIAQTAEAHKKKIAQKGRGITSPAKYMSSILASSSEPKEDKPKMQAVLLEDA